MSTFLRRIPPEPTCFLLVAATWATYLLVAGDDRFYHDAASYWQLGELFGQNAHFSLLAYDHPYRGYSLPLWNHGLDIVASVVEIGDSTIVQLTGSLLVATLGVMVVPRLARALFSEAAVSWGRVLALNGLLFLFWRDHIGFPLSDFPALLAACVGVLGLLRATKAGYLVAGLSFGLAANLRPAYLLAAVGAVVLATLVSRRPWKSLAHIFALALVLAGALVVSLPQMAINHHHRDSWSPTLDGAKEIGTGQLAWGLVLQKYETYVGPSSEYPRQRVLYFDPVANDVRQEEGVSDIESYREYGEIVLRHPVTMSVSYLLHVFNGIDVRHATPYIRDLRGSPLVFSLLLYTLVFGAGARLALPGARRRLGEIRWVGVGLLLLPTLTAIPGAVEPRFFLPLHLLVLMLVCFGPGVAANVYSGSSRRRIGLAVAYVLFVAVSVTLSAATQAQIEHPLADAASSQSSPSFEDLERTGAGDHDETLTVEDRPNVGHRVRDPELAREDPPDLIALDVRDPAHARRTLPELF